MPNRSPRRRRRRSPIGPSGSDAERGPTIKRKRLKVNNAKSLSIADYRGGQAHDDEQALELFDSTSFRICVSRLKSATNAFCFLFSFSSSFSRRTSATPKPADFFFQR